MYCWKAFRNFYTKSEVFNGVQSSPWELITLPTKVASQEVVNICSKVASQEVDSR